MKREKWKSVDDGDVVVSSAVTLGLGGRCSASVYDGAGNTVVVVCDRNAELVERVLERLGMVRV